MTNYDYLIIGGGMTAAAGVDGIREVDPTGAIGMISTEPDAPYSRPPLSKALWKGQSRSTRKRSPSVLAAASCPRLI